MTDQSRERRTRNELVAKAHNLHAKRLAEHVLDQEAKAALPLGFTCECSNLQCVDTIPLTAQEYSSLHRRSDCFVIKPGHERTDIERVIRAFPNPTRPEYCVAEKYLL